MSDEHRAIEIAELTDDEVRAQQGTLEAEYKTAAAIVRVAIAVELAHATRERKWTMELEALASSPDEAVAIAAELALLQLAEKDGYAAIVPGLGVESFTFETRIDATAFTDVQGQRLTVIVHGTWASHDVDAWWKPAGDFYKYLKNDAKVPGLYAESSSFSWSGKNQDSARTDAGKAFASWLNELGPSPLHVIGHSHGANVALLATTYGLVGRIDNLVMLSAPLREDYIKQADWAKIPRVRSVQAEHDAVVAIARGGKTFPKGFKTAHPHVDLDELVLAGESGHSKSHTPAIWKTPAFSLPSWSGLP